MKLSRLQALGSLVLAAILSVPGALADTRGANSPLPGTLNYVEGQATIGDQTLGSNSIGSTTLQTGQSIATDNGKAEVLLTPGVFLRLDDNSSAKMLSPSITYTEVGLQKGRAMVEVAEIHPENDLRIRVDGATTQLLKKGIYSFDANQGVVRVFDGEARVQDGDSTVKVKGGHELALNETGKLKAEKFDKDAYTSDDLYRWSSLRSSYLAEANADAARTYFVNGWYGPGWYGTGWYWDPWFSAYTFIPADGIFYSPFGWGFYSPLVVYRSPFLYGGHYYHNFGPYYRPGVIAHGYVGPRAGHGFRAVPPPRTMAPQARGFGFHSDFHGGFGPRR
ncbi:MAG TPA: FecR domain-containing protein [Terriglobales bacterium]|nr:FecR domain-containing protein [Terriglobales bacterium]